MHDQKILCFDVLAAKPLVYPQASSFAFPLLGKKPKVRSSCLVKKANMVGVNKLFNGYLLCRLCRE